MNRSVNIGKVIPHLHFKRCLFDLKVTFDLYGIATFANCILYGHHFLINLRKSKLEPEVQFEEFPSYAKQYKLSIIETKLLIMLESFVGFHVEVASGVRGISVKRCHIRRHTENLYKSIFRFKVGYLFDKFTAAIISIKDCLIAKAVFYMFPPQKHLKYSAGYVEMENLALHDSIVFKTGEGVVGFQIKNCSFEASDLGVFILEALLMSM